TAEGGPAGRSSAAPHGVQVQASSGGGQAPRSPARRVLSAEGKGRPGDGGWARPHQAEGHTPYARSAPGVGQRRGGHAHLHGRPGDVYPRVANPAGPAAPSRSPRVAKQGLSGGAK